MIAFRPINFYCVNRHFRKWINSVFNKVDFQRIKDVGADRAASEWLLRCGASVKWKDDQQWINDYNKLPEVCDNKSNIVEIDATDSCIMHIGFRYLEGLKDLKRIKFCKCIYLENKCLYELSVIKHSLEHLEVISCGNISDNGINAITHLGQLKSLFLYDLPEVKNREQCISALKKNLPFCKVDFPVVVES